MTERERVEKLIRAAEMTAWTPELREMLLWELRNRGIHVSRHADCGEMADTLQLDLDRPSSTQPKPDSSSRSPRVRSGE